MNLSGKQIALKILSFFELLMGLLALSFGTFMIRGGTAMVSPQVRSLNTGIDNSPIFIPIGIILLFEGIFAFSNVSFIKAMHRNPARYRQALYFSIITFIFNGINLVFAVICHVNVSDIIMTALFMGLNVLIIYMIRITGKQTI